MGAGKEMWIAEGERMAQAFIDKEIGEAEFRAFLKRHFHSRSPDDPEINEIVDALLQDREAS